MAKFAKWAEWRAMARDVSNALSHLSIRQNFDAAEFRWQRFKMEIFSHSSMPLGARDLVDARFFDLGGLVAIHARINVTIAAGGTATSLLYLSLPFPYDASMETVFQLHAISSGVINSRGPNGALTQKQWIALQQRDGSGLPISWYPGDTVALLVFGIYAKDLKYQYTLGPVSPSAVTPVSVSNSDWRSWSPVLSGTSMTFGSITNSEASYKRLGDLVFGSMSILFTPATTAESGVLVTLPVNHAGFNITAGSGRITNITTGDQRIAPILLGASDATRLFIVNGPGPTFTNLVLGDAYRLDGTFTYRSAHS